MLGKKKDYPKTGSNMCKWYPVCPVKRFDDSGIIDKKWVKSYCKGKWKTCIRFQMEEKGEYHPDWMLPDGSLDLKLKNG